MYQYYPGNPTSGARVFEGDWLTREGNIVEIFVKDTNGGKSAISTYVHLAPGDTLSYYSNGATPSKKKKRKEEKEGGKR